MAKTKLPLVIPNATDKVVSSLLSAEGALTGCGVGNEVLPCSEVVLAPQADIAGPGQLWSIDELNGDEEVPTEAVMSQRHERLFSFLGEAGQPVFKDFRTYELGRLAYCRGLAYEVIIDKLALKCTPQQLMHYGKREEWHVTRLRAGRMRAEQLNGLLEALAEDATAKMALMAHADITEALSRPNPVNPNDWNQEIKAKAQVVATAERLGLNLVAKKEASKASGTVINIGIIGRADPTRAGIPAGMKVVAQLEASTPEGDAVRRERAEEKVIELRAAPEVF